ncbi:MAG TPA: YetF domain-containing protein [Candidatus Limnocylindrales bacterium]|nr:YetF domain-containing protein [Candidatus Limnocylindrales bacterium]
MTIPDLGSDLLGVALRTAIVYVALVLAFRLMGKSRTGQLSTMDLIVLLVIANAVQNAMVGENTSLVGGLIAAAVVLVLDRALHFLTERSRPARRALEGQPTLLVEDGRVDHDRLRKEGITPDELGMALRQNGLLRAEEARYVFLETTGIISVIPYRDERPGGGGAPPPRAVG